LIAAVSWALPSTHQQGSQHVSCRQSATLNLTCWLLLLLLFADVVVGRRYVMRRAVGVYEQLVKRFTAQTTDYQQLLSTFAEGLYTEMDFRNEALNAQRMRELLDAAESGAGRRLVIPAPFLEYTTR
jgi:hypothetical protein